MIIGILALQGAFIEHEAMLKQLDIPFFEIRQRKDIDRPFDGLILPGGESTVMGRLLRETGLLLPLQEKIRQGLPVFGTCAGMILLAKSVEGGVPCFSTMDICVKRNAYGRQLGSFHTSAVLDPIGRVPMTFIRAPYIRSAGEEVQILASVDGHMAAARQGNQLVTAFHPELTEDLSVHRYFANMISNVSYT